MPMSGVFANDLLAFIFNQTALPSFTTPLYISLHTADPSAGNQTTSEATFTSYARVAVAATSGGFTIATNTMSNTAAITFPQATGGSNVITNVGIGTASSGAGVLLYAGALTSSLTVTNNIQPQFAIGALTITQT